MRSGEGAATPDPSVYKTFRRNRSLRLPAFDYASTHVYFVTIVVANKRPLFSQTRYAEAVFDCLLQCRKRYHYTVYVYCLMPDHLHMLVMPQSNCVGLPQFIGSFKSLSTRALWRLEHKGVLWQTHYYEHVVRNEESLAGIVEYILDNPVRRGVVPNRTEYVFCGVVDEIDVS